MSLSKLLLASTFLLALGCAGQSQVTSSSYPENYKTSGYPVNPDIYFAEEASRWKTGLPPDISQPESGFFFLKPNYQTWRAYYYLFHQSGGVDEYFRTYPDIDVVTNHRVQRYIDYFTGRGHKYMSRWLSRSGKYIPMMEEILKAKGMPSDLVYLAMIESGFNVRAESHASAVGPWQFIEETAKRYGLRVDSWVDERMDPEKSTVAASRYLSDLYEMFYSWELAAAGYNCGEDRVQAAIDKYQTYDFWELSERTLPRETKDYVPKLMAALKIAKSPEQYGFYGISYQSPERFDKAYVPARKNLTDIGRMIGVSGERLIEINPALKRGVTPPDGSYQIRVPGGYAKVLALKRDDIDELPDSGTAIVAARSDTDWVRYRVRRGETLSKISARYGVSISALKRANAIKGSFVKSGQILNIPFGTGGRLAEYTVRRGDTLGAIAARHRVSITTIRRANRINGSKIVPGQILKIPGSTGRYLDENTTVVTVAKAKTQPLTQSETPTKYRVRRGDSLGTIAARYGTTVSALKQANGISGSKIFVGKVLTVPGGSKPGSPTTGSKQAVNHKVRKGENLGKIAERYGTSVSSIKRANGIRGSKILPGQVLKVPGASKSLVAENSSEPASYKVKSGDSLGGIATRYGTSISAIKRVNGIRGSVIRVGQMLTIPGGGKGGGIIKHKVRRGDTLWDIASKYGVSISSIKKWNNLKSTRLVAGERLRIYR